MLIGRKGEAIVPGLLAYGIAYCIARAPGAVDVVTQTGRVAETLIRALTMPYTELLEEVANNKGVPLTAIHTILTESYKWRDYR